MRHRCMHVPDWLWRTLLRLALLGAQQPYSASSITLQGMFTCPRGHRPRPERTIPFSWVLGRLKSFDALHPFQTEFRVFTSDAAGPPACARQQQQPAGVPLYASIACPMTSIVTPPSFASTWRLLRNRVLIAHCGRPLVIFCQDCRSRRIGIVAA